MNEKVSLPVTDLPEWESVPMELERLYREAVEQFQRKIIVIDDDPTGIQTVHGVSVYTNWDEESIRSGFAEKEKLFYLMTNSRGMTSDQAERINRQIAQRVCKISREMGKDFVLISRGDSTMRGHWPLETEVLRKEVEQRAGKRFDGEIIMPFFLEGGRYTIHNIHYVRDKNLLIPAGETEFARDKTFGYVHSHIGRWCEEKTEGRYRAEDCIYVALADIRNQDIDRITHQLTEAKAFQKIIVNAVSYEDVEVFCIACIRAMEAGKEFLFRTAAAWPKILGGITSRPLLTHEELTGESPNGGIVLVGSHVNKTTMQLKHLHDSGLPISFMEFDATLVRVPNGLQLEAQRVALWAKENISQGRSVAIYTTRKRIDFDDLDKERQLEMSVAISNALTSVIGLLTVKPSFILAKGGITSSDVGTRALRVVKATVMGQIVPGVPVWRTGEESKFPNMPYVIFPGNVGDETTLTCAVKKLMRKSKEN